MKRYSLFVSSLALVVICFGGRLQAQTVVIVNKSVPSATSFTAEELKDVYTLNKTRWDDDSRITVFDLKGGKAKESFYEYIDMSEEELQRIWLRKQFTGKARPPRSHSDEEEIVDRVGSTPGAIGYVSESAVGNNKKVRIVARIRGKR